MNDELSCFIKDLQKRAGILESLSEVEQNPLGINITPYIQQIKQLDAELDNIYDVYGCNVTDSSYDIINSLYEKLLKEKFESEQEEYLDDEDMRREYFEDLYGSIEGAIDDMVGGEEMTEEEFLNTVGKDYFNDWADNQYTSMRENNVTDEKILDTVYQLVRDAREQFLFPRINLLEKIFNQNGFSLNVETSHQSDSTYFSLSKEFEDKDFYGHQIRWSDHTDYYGSSAHAWFSDTLETTIEGMIDFWSEEFKKFRGTVSNV